MNIWCKCCVNPKYSGMLDVNKFGKSHWICKYKGNVIDKYTFLNVRYLRSRENYGKYEIC